MANKVVSRSEVRGDLPRPGVVVRNHDIRRSPLAILETGLIDLEPNSAEESVSTRDWGLNGKRNALRRVPGLDILARGDLSHVGDDRALVRVGPDSPLHVDGRAGTGSRHKVGALAAIAAETVDR